MLNMPLYRIHKFVYDTEQSCWRMPQMPQCLCIRYWSFLHTELSYFTMYALCSLVQMNVKHSEVQNLNLFQGQN